MICHRIVNSIFNSCTYILHYNGAKEAIIIDCGDVRPILDYLSNKKLILSAIFITHSHFDHIYGLLDLTKLFPSTVVYTSVKGIVGLKNPKYNISHYHPSTSDFIFESENVHILSDGCVINVAELMIKIIATEGHDWSCLSYLIDNLLFTGDSYIPGVKVVANWPKSNNKQANDSLLILQKLESNGVEIKAGHIVNL